MPGVSCFPSGGHATLPVRPEGDGQLPPQQSAFTYLIWTQCVGAPLASAVCLKVSDH